MSVTAVDSNIDVSNTQQAKFDAAVNNAEQSAADDAEFNEALITNAVVIGGQFIIMPRAQEILKEAQSDDDE
ncbi:hypothetical protein EGJ27_01530 [Pseudomonas sp. v388]|uniref:hypothetical protein n=1 Tax=Pseudomonas sp. v388 TaxID=2479849 RepID=UPI000F76B334|nr:hypothetical protein [Pseudomonas sp. v388]RRV10331.1 hypothetical protein EGJ27_01530 [Pseudomonas sp. v388]